VAEDERAAHTADVDASLGEPVQVRATEAYGPDPHRDLSRGDRRPFLVVETDVAFAMEPGDPHPPERIVERGSTGVSSGPYVTFRTEFSRTGSAA
jgi:hypothetical protein